MAVVWIPSPLQRLAAGNTTVAVAGATLREVIDNLERVHPGFKEALLEDGRLRAGAAVAVDGNVVRAGLYEPVSDTSEIHILPAMGGGQEG